MKRRTNVTLDEGLREEARAYEINLSETLKEAVEAKIREERARRWQEENREAFESYRRFHETYGTLTERQKALR